MITQLSVSDNKQATMLVSMIVAGGNTVSVYDGEDWVVKQYVDAACILAKMGTTEADTLRVRDHDDVIIGTFYLVYGNEPGVLIADHTDNQYCNQLSGAMAALFDTM